VNGWIRRLGWLDEFAHAAALDRASIAAGGIAGGSPSAVLGAGGPPYGGSERSGAVTGDGAPATASAQSATPASGRAGSDGILATDSAALADAVQSCDEEAAGKMSSEGGPVMPLAMGGSNEPPVAGPDTASTMEDTAVEISVLANDSDPDGNRIFTTDVTQPTNGRVTFTASTPTYTPARDYYGGDSFSYTIKDGHGGSATADVSVSVSALDDWPVALEDYAVTAVATPVVIDVLSNDSDPEGSVSVQYVDPYSMCGGTVLDNGDGTVTYTPQYWEEEDGSLSGYSGFDEFSYSIEDSTGNSATGLANSK
jgi:hypothetical protein